MQKTPPQKKKIRKRKKYYRNLEEAFLPEELGKTSWSKPHLSWLEAKHSFLKSPCNLVTNFIMKISLEILVWGFALALTLSPFQSPLHIYKQHGSLRALAKLFSA